MLFFRKNFLIGLWAVVLTAALEFDITKQKDSNLMKCLHALLQKENIDEKFGFVRTFGIFVHEDESFENKLIFGEMIDEFLAIPSNIINPVDQSRIQTFEYKIHTKILFVDSVKTFNLLVRTIRNTTLEISGLYQNFFILLPNLTTYDTQAVIGQILRSCLKLLIADVNILIEDHQGTVNIYTYFPFTPTSCRNSTPVLYNRFKNGRFQLKKSVFPKKTRNLWKCPLKAIVWDNEPLMRVRKNQIDGMEISFLRILAGVMNFSLEFVISPNGRGDVLEDGTTLGSFKMIKDGHGDLMFGGNACTQLRRTFFASTKEYLSVKMDIVIKTTRTYSAFEILLIPFEGSSWFTILLIIVGKWVWTFLLKKQFLRRNARKFSTVQAIRFQLVSWLLGTFILRCLYEGSMFKFFYDHPNKEPPRNLEELISRGFVLITKNTNRIVFRSEEVPFDKVLYVESWAEAMDTFFNSSHRKLALLMFTDFIAYDHVASTLGKRLKEYRATEFPVSVLIFCGSLPKFSFLTEEINRLISQFKTTGQIKRIYQVNYGGSVRNFDSSVNFLLINQLLGIFQCLVVCWSAGGLVLLLEMFSKRNEFLGKLMNFLH